MQRVIDSHFHIWRQQDLPWLVGPMVPRIFGPYKPIRRDYPIEEFLADQRGLGSRKPFMSRLTGPKTASKRRLHGFRKRRTKARWPHAIVGFADMTVDDVAPATRSVKALSSASRSKDATALA